jgi:RimJ/RimL family protein N-acetyltransferase
VGRALMKVLETQRMILRWFEPGDAAFILELVNDPDWLRFIGDKKVRTLDDARAYIEKGPVAMYAKYGLGLYLVELKDGAVPIGMCGLIRREGLADVDIGFAFLPSFRGSGYAFESAQATMDYGKRVLGLKRIVAITSPGNEDSSRLLEKIGMRFESTVRMPGGDEELRLYAST